MEISREARPTILLIIEDWHERALIHAQLVEDGFEARTSLSVAQALTLLSRQFWPKLSAIVADVADRAPDEGLAAQLAKLASYAPVIALTGSYGPRPTDLVRLGAQVALRRPLTVGQISRAVQESVKVEAARRSGCGGGGYARQG